MANAPEDTLECMSVSKIRQHLEAREAHVPTEWVMKRLEVACKVVDDTMGCYTRDPDKTKNARRITQVATRTDDLPNEPKQKQQRLCDSLESDSTAADSLHLCEREDPDEQSSQDEQSTHDTEVWGTMHLLGEFKVAKKQLGSALLGMRNIRLVQMEENEYVEGLKAADMAVMKAVLHQRTPAQREFVLKKMLGPMNLMDRHDWESLETFKHALERYGGPKLPTDGEWIFQDQLLARRDMGYWMSENYLRPLPVFEEAELRSAISSTTTSPSTQANDQAAAKPGN